MHVCLYHGSDLDGLCSGAIYQQFHYAVEHELIPIDYGDPIPWEKLAGNDVTLIDFSLQPWQEFDKLFQVAASVCWIDHHRSAINEWKNSEQTGKWCPHTTVLDETQAACELAWQHYYPGIEPPIAVQLLGRYDVWDHEADKRVLPFQYGMRLFDLDPRNGHDQDLWNSFLSEHHDVQQQVDTGNNLLKYQRQKDATAVAKAWFPLDWAGKRWQACNRLGKGSSFFDSVRDAGQYDGVLSFVWDGSRWEIGLYSERDDIDCGAIAKQHGGGGHPGAAGFRCEILPFRLGEHS
jgi:hypothetical protein